MLKQRCVVVICDSLRNDLVGVQTPTLDLLERMGTRFTQVQAVFPSTTRVSSASIATGCHPQRHGLLGNTMILSEQPGLVTRSVGKPEFRQQLYAATGRYLKVPTLAERLHEKFSTAIYSNVSPGAAYFFDPASFGYVYHPAGSYGPGGLPLAGDQALDIKQGWKGDREMTERFCARLLSDDSLALGVLWLSEPDASGHAQCLGNQLHLDAIGNADACVARVLDVVTELRRSGQEVLLMVGSDHGMETVTYQIDIAQALVEAGLKHELHSHEIVVAPNGTAAILGFDDDYAYTFQLMAWLDQQRWVGEWVMGQALATWGLPDEPACRIAISLAGDNSLNEAGLAGTSWYAFDPDTPKHMIGQGQHGGRHRHERHPFLIINGGAFPPSEKVSATVCLTDYAPTILEHLAMPSDDMQGQPLQQLLPGNTGITSTQSKGSL